MKTKSIYAYLLMVLMLFSIISCAGGSSELIKEKDDELVKLHAELEQLDEKLQADSHQIQQLEQKKAELSQKLDMELLTRIQKEVEIDSLKKILEASTVVGNRIILPEAVLFNSGSAELSERGKQFIDEIGEILSKYSDREVLIEGHSDNVPIAKGYRWKYKSNWELSAARAMVVLHYLEDHKRINKKRLGVVAFGEQRPMASNELEQGRADNRRVEIVIGAIHK